MQRMIVTMTLGAFGLVPAVFGRPQMATAMGASPRGNGETTFHQPPIPTGKSTVLGGQIARVDPVQDQLVLKVYGGKPVKVLFDERTQVYRDGKRIPLLELAAAPHASVQTALDGASVFAISIHILSAQPEGQYQGRVLSFNRDSGVLVLTSAPDRPPFRLIVSKEALFKRVGQEAFSSVQSGPADLTPGALVAVEFDSNNGGRGMATEISVLAAPGANFIFSGTVSELNLAAGTLELVDPRDNKSYDISFDPQAPASEQLRIGGHVRLSAAYDGHKYVATQITVE